jgi:hypothetical protein
MMAGDDGGGDRSGEGRGGSKAKKASKTSKNERQRALIFTHLHRIFTLPFCRKTRCFLHRVKMVKINKSY